MDKLIPIGLAFFAGIATQRILDSAGVAWLPGFIAGLIVLVVVLLLATGRRSKS